MMNYVIIGEPRSKKNSMQIIKVKGRMMLIPSKAYKDYEKLSGLFLHPKPDQPIDTPVNVKCTYYMRTHRRVDLVNLLEATCDILVKHGILKDDNCAIVVAHDGSRVLYDKDNPRAVICIENI